MKKSKTEIKYYMVRNMAKYLPDRCFIFSIKRRKLANNGRACAAAYFFKYKNVGEFKNLF
jgi:hypothetical protein